MTDRLAELRQGELPASSSATRQDDIETGADGDNDGALAAFNREADAIDKVYVWAHRSINTIADSLSDPDALPSATAQLDTIDQKVQAVRKRLKRIDTENKELAASREAAPATLRIRVARSTKLGTEFMDVVSALQRVRERHRAVTADAVKRDVLRANPRASEAQVERALQPGHDADLEAVVLAPGGDHAQMRHQVEDLRARNHAIQGLAKNIVELQQMFTDMSILVQGQQELINNIEYNVKEVKVDTKKATEELVEARRHQKSANKKKMCICIIITLVIVGVALAILIPMALRNNWFGSANAVEAVTGNNPSQTPTPAPAAGRSSLVTLAKEGGQRVLRSRWFE